MTLPSHSIDPSRRLRGRQRVASSSCQDAPLPQSVGVAEKKEQRNFIWLSSQPQWWTKHFKSTIKLIHRPKLLCVDDTTFHLFFVQNVLNPPSRIHLVLRPPASSTRNRTFPQHKRIGGNRYSAFFLSRMKTKDESGPFFFARSWAARLHVSLSSHPWQLRNYHHTRTNIHFPTSASVAGEIDEKAAGA